jgi:hippurate hydrolase
VAAELFGDGATLRLGNPITGSEDFSVVIAEVPGAMLFLGATTDDQDPMSAPGNHSPRAAFDDRVLGDGAALYAELAARSLVR